MNKASIVIAAAIFHSAMALEGKAGSELVAAVKVDANGALSEYRSDAIVSVTVDEQKALIITNDAGDPGQTTQEIVDLDLGIIALGHSGAYSITIADRSDEIYAARDFLTAATHQGLPFDLQSCAWDRSRDRIKETKEFKRVNRSKAYRHIITSAQTCTIPGTEQQCRITWQLDVWMSNKSKRHDNEIARFFGEYGDELGASPWLPRLPRQAQTLISLFPDRWEQMLDNVTDLEGTPLEIDMNVSVGRSRCVSDEQNKLWSDSLAAARRVGASGVGSAVSDEAGEAMGDSVGGKISSSVVGSVASSVFGNLGKSKSSSRARAAPDVPLYRIQWTSQAWKTGPSVTVELPNN